MNRRMIAVWPVSLMLGSSSCVSDSAVRIEPEGPITYDGLHRVEQPSLDEAWAMPDLDLTRYRNVPLEPTEVSCREVKSRSTLHSRTSTQGDFPLSDVAKAKLQDIVHKAFEQQLSQSSFYGLADRAARDVLLIRAPLIDVVSHVPPQPIGRSDIYLRSIGEATLVLELRDAVTDEILARAVDRRAADHADLFIEFSTVTAWSEVRLVAKGWASLLRQRLDEYVQLGTWNESSC
ncbi:MAG: DUF3313 family protein [Pseudomonadales bacterium]